MKNFSEEKQPRSMILPAPCFMEEMMCSRLDAVVVFLNRVFYRRVIAMDAQIQTFGPVSIADINTAEFINILFYQHFYLIHCQNNL